MQKKHFLAFFITATLLIAASTLSTSLDPQAQAKFAAPDGGCWCTTYVANHYHLPPSYPNAKKWSGWLRKLGWKRDHIPHSGDIAVLQPNINGANGLYGHVGIIRTTKRVTQKQWNITLRGAYQRLHHEFKDSNCHNVSDWTSTLSTGHHSGVLYFYKLGVSR
jgi:hypothetical protein